MGLFSRKKILFRTRSKFNDINVTRKGNIVSLWCPEDVRQSAMNLKKPLQPYLEYNKLLLLCLAFCPEPTAILVLGLGGGVVPSILNDLCRKAVIDVVEIDEHMVPVAKNYFGFRTSQKMNLFVLDASAHLRNTSKTYDIIILDTYLGYNLPTYTITPQFWEDCTVRLSPGGIIAANLMTGKKERLEKRLELVGRFLQHMWLVSARATANMVVFAGNKPLSKTDILKNAAVLENTYRSCSGVRRWARRLKTRLK
jgi:spermidine synthase